MIWLKATLPAEFIINVIKIDLKQTTNQFMELQVRGEGGIDRIRNIADRKYHLTLKILMELQVFRFMEVRKIPLRSGLMKKPVKHMGYQCHRSQIF